MRQQKLVAAALGVGPTSMADRTRHADRVDVPDDETIATIPADYY
jgi:hypothetical protein